MKLNSTQLPLLGLLLASAALSTACAVDPERATGAYGPTYFSSDAGIAERVQATLQNQPGLDVKQIKVETFKGMVQLSGHVKSHAQLVTTVAAVDHLDGIKTVRDYLIVNPPKPIVGSAIRVAHAPIAAPATVVATTSRTASPLQIASNVSSAPSSSSDRSAGGGSR